MSDLTGKTLGKYRLIERLGRGGMAEVYKAYQPRLDRYVAVKLMHGYLAEDEGFVERFQREAKAIAALHHPHIVQVHDFDIQDDVYYMVQEYVEGGTLKSKLKEANEQGKPIPLEETIRIMTAICQAVDYAHKQGRIHRDIKPDNIMFDQHDRPVLTDFGIASIVGGTRLTATGAMVGTPTYMSPEQGKGFPGDERSDVYSLGVVLYEMVTGRVPFDADTPFAVVLKHVNDPLPMPRTLNPDIPPSIERVILKALAKEPEDRYQTAAELGQSLQEIAQDITAPDWGTPLKLGDLQETPAPQGSAPADQKTTVTPPPQRVSPPQAGPARKSRAWLWILVAVVGIVFLACCGLAGLNVIRKRAQQAQMTKTAVAQASTPEMTATTAPDQTEQPLVTATLPPSSPEVQNLIQSGFEILGEMYTCPDNIDGALELFEQAIEQCPRIESGWRLWVNRQGANIGMS